MMQNPHILRRLKRWKASPLLFVQEAFDWSKLKQNGPSDQQAELLHTFPKHKRTSVRSGHGTGKDAGVSWLILNFLVTRPYSKVPTTAPTARQLNDILWSELSKWLRLSVFADEFVVQKDKIFHKSAPKEWWCRAISPSVKASKEDQAETLAGLHSEHLLIVVDESSGVPDPVFIPLEGAMTQEDNKVILIGNPTKNTGYFHETQFDQSISKKWNKLHWDSRYSSNVAPEMVEYFRDKYGEESNVFRIRVAGEPPLDDENTFIPLSWAIECVGNELEVDPEWPLFLSVDVARYGEDKSIILPRRGNKIYRWESFQGMHTMELANTICYHHRTLDAYASGVDSIGVGGGVVDWLQNDPRGLGRDKTIEINVAERATNPKKYHRLRDELWDAAREKCMKRKFSFPDEIVRTAGQDINIGHELANELGSVKYKTLDNGALKIESKLDMKARGVSSPNIADAVVNGEYFGLILNSKVIQKLRKRKGNPYKPKKLSGKHAWMVV